MERYKEYKDSGVQWIGEIPSHWGLLKLSQVSYEHYISNKEIHHQNLLSLSYGKIIRKDINTAEGLLPASFDTYQIVEDGNIVLRLTDLQNDHKSLRVGLAKEKGIITSAYVCLGVFNSMFPSYLYNVLHSYDIKKLFYSMGGGLRQNLNWQGLKKIDIPLPPLSEQERIVNYIESKTSKIDEYLDCQKQELYLYKELIESIIYSKNTTDNIVFTSWENFFDSTWHTELGKGLFNEVEIKGFSSERFLAVTQDKGLIYKDVDGVNFVTAEKKETQKLVCPGEYVISLRSFEGGIEYSTIKGLVSPAYVVLRLREEYNTREYQMYFRFLFKSVPFVNRLNSISDSMRDGKAIKFSDIKHFPFPIPSNKKLEEIFKLSEIYDVKRKAFEEKKLLLEQYKQRLIADCVTGQVNVQNETI